MFLLVGCASDNGSKIVGGNLSVYYSSENLKEKAISVAQFWKKNDLLVKTPQAIKLSKVKNQYQLQIIASEPKEVANMSFSERKTLLALQTKIKEELFADKDFELVICNNKFESIYSIN